MKLLIIIFALLTCSCAIHGRVTGLRQALVYGHESRGSRFGFAAVPDTLYMLELDRRRWCAVSRVRYDSTLVGDPISC